MEKIKTRRYSECARCTYQCSASGKAEVGLSLILPKLEPFTPKRARKSFEFCKKKNLYLFMDGARLGHALTAKSNDVTWEDVAD